MDAIAGSRCWRSARTSLCRSSASRCARAPTTSSNRGQLEGDADQRVGAREEDRGFLAPAGLVGQLDGLVADAVVGVEERPAVGVAEVGADDDLRAGARHHREDRLADEVAVVEELTLRNRDAV